MRASSDLHFFPFVWGTSAAEGRHNGPLWPGPCARRALWVPGDAPCAVVRIANVRQSGFLCCRSPDVAERSTSCDQGTRRAS